MTREQASTEPPSPDPDGRGDGTGTGGDAPSEEGGSPSAGSGSPRAGDGSPSTGDGSSSAGDGSPSAERTTAAAGGRTPAAGSPRGALPGTVTTLVGLAAAGFVLMTLQLAQSIAAPIVLALVIAIAVSPLQTWLARTLPGWLAMIVVIVVTYAGLTVFVALLAWALFAFGREVPTYQAQLNDLFTQTTDQLAALGLETEQLDELLRSVDLGAAAGVALDVARGFYGAVSVIALSLTLLLFLVIDGGSFGRRFAAVRRIRPTVAASLSTFAVGVRRYLVVTTVFGAIVAILDVVLLLALGVPLALVWGVLAFVTGYIPTIGLVLGLVPPVIIALLEDGWPTALAVLVGYLLINNLIQSFIQPKFIGDAVGLSISTSFLSLVVWGFVLGPLGAILAIPMSLMAKAVLTDSVPGHQWIGILLSDKAPPDDEVDALARGAAAREGRAVP